MHRDVKKFIITWDFRQRKLKFLQQLDTYNKDLDAYQKKMKAQIEMMQARQGLTSATVSNSSLPKGPGAGSALVPILEGGGSHADVEKRVAANAPKRPIFHVRTLWSRLTSIDFE